MNESRVFMLNGTDVQKIVERLKIKIGDGKYVS